MQSMILENSFISMFCGCLGYWDPQNCPTSIIIILGLLWKETTEDKCELLSWMPRTKLSPSGVDPDLQLDLNKFLAADVSSGSAWLWMRWHVLFVMIPFRLKTSSSALRRCVLSRSENWNGISKLSQVQVISCDLRLSLVISSWFILFINSSYSSHSLGPDAWFRWWV